MADEREDLLRQVAELRDRVEQHRADVGEIDEQLARLRHRLMTEYGVPRVGLDMLERFSVLRTLTSARQSTDERYLGAVEAALRDDEHAT